MIFLFISLLTNVEFKDTEIYKPLTFTNVAISPEGEVFVLDRDECQILCYDQNGNLVKKAGRKGQGPGEFTNAYGIKIINPSIFVLDRDGVHIFNFKGEFQQKVDANSWRQEIEPLKAGWVLTKTQFDPKENQITNEFKLLDSEQNEQLTLGESSHKNLFSMKDGKATVTFNPAGAFPFVKSDQNGSFVVFKSSSDFPIQVFSILPKIKKVFEVNLTDRAPLPFNEIWAEKELGKRIERQKGSNSPVSMEFESNYPVTFPIVKSVRISPDNLLLVLLWSKDPENPEILAYDWTGKQQAYSLNEKTLNRLVYLKGDQAYVSAYDEDNEDYILIKMPKNQAADYIEKHPYIEEF